MLRVQVVDEALDIAGICGNPEAGQFSNEVTPEHCQELPRPPSSPLRLLIELVRGHPLAIRLGREQLEDLAVGEVHQLAAGDVDAELPQLAAGLFTLAQSPDIRGAE